MGGGGKAPGQIVKHGLQNVDTEGRNRSDITRS